MKKYLIATLTGLMAITMIQAQEYKLAKTTGKLVLNLSSVKVEGYNGNEIVFSSAKENKEVDERAKGLRPISGSGYSDNTGLGISVEDKGATIEVNQVSPRDGQIKVMVPKGISISYAYSKVMNNGKAQFKNIESEIEIAVQYNSIELENITGPVSAKAVYGSIDAKFSPNIKGPVSLVSIYGHVDVSVPATTKANLKLNTSYGEILASSDLKIEIEKNAGKDMDPDMVSYNNNNIKGKIGGGGTDFTLRSDYSKIYLRKSN
jgi:hypothetical protein